MKTMDKVYRKADRTPFTLTKRLGGGAEGEVFCCAEKEESCIKIYKEEVTENLLKKLNYMIANPPIDSNSQSNKYKSIAWPNELVYQAPDSAMPCGFRMPYSPTAKSIVSYYNTYSRRQNDPDFNYYYLNRTAYNLCCAIRAIHQKGYVVGDMRETNILATREALITIIDTDSFQVTTSDGTVFRSEKGRYEYTPKEIQGYSFREIDRNECHDRFALSVNLFLLLMEGYHPFRGVSSDIDNIDTTQRVIREGHFPYLPSAAGIWKPQGGSPLYEMLAPGLRQLFERCFVDGIEDPEVRPSAGEWCVAFRAEGVLEDPIKMSGRK